MSISAKVKALISMQEKKQMELIPILGMSSKQSLSNKFANGRWSADDLARVAVYCGCKLAFVLPDGQQIIIEPENENTPDT